MCPGVEGTCSGSWAGGLGPGGQAGAGGSSRVLSALVPGVYVPPLPAFPARMQRGACVRASALAREVIWVRA